MSIIRYINTEKRHMVLAPLLMKNVGFVCGHIWVNINKEPKLYKFDEAYCGRVIVFSARPTAYRKANFEVQYGLKEFKQIKYMNEFYFTDSHLPQVTCHAVMVADGMYHISYPTYEGIVAGTYDYNPSAVLSYILTGRWNVTQIIALNPDGGMDEVRTILSEEIFFKDENNQAP